MAVAFEKLGVELIEQLAEKVIGEIIQAIENLITNKADNPIREAFTQEQVGKAMALVNEPTNCMVIFEHDKHDASDLIKNGWKMGKIKCACPHANNTLQYECYVGKKPATFHLQADGGFLNWCFGGKYNRHGNDVSFESV